jgi:hypothetical protein
MEEETMETIKETFTKATQDIAMLILASSLAPWIGNPNNPYRLDHVKEAAENGVDSAWGLSIEFEREGTSIVLHLRADPDCYQCEGERDERGDEYHRYVFHTCVNWPTHGDTKSYAALARLEFYKEVTMLAADLDDMFGGNKNSVLKLFCTKEQREEQTEAEKEQRVRFTISAVISQVRKGLRVNGNARFLRGEQLELLKDVPAGKYVYEFNDGKKYILLKCVVNSLKSPLGNASIARIA